MLATSITPSLLLISGWTPFDGHFNNVERFFFIPLIPSDLSSSFFFFTPVEWNFREMKSSNLNNKTKKKKARRCAIVSLWCQKASISSITRTMLKDGWEYILFPPPPSYIYSRTRRGSYCYSHCPSDRLWQSVVIFFPFRFPDTQKHPSILQTGGGNDWNKNNKLMTGNHRLFFSIHQRK